MSDLAATTTHTKRNESVECIDPENIVIALPRSDRGNLTVSGGVRTLPAERPSVAIDGINEDTEPVLAD